MPSRRVTILLSSLIPGATAGSGQSADDRWQVFRPIFGQWNGEASGFGSVSEVTHHCEFVVNGRFLRLQTTSIARAEGCDVHQDVDYLSHDDERAWFVVRQFCRESASCPGESRSSTRNTSSTVEPNPPPARDASGVPTGRTDYAPTRRCNLIVSRILAKRGSLLSLRTMGSSFTKSR